MEKFIDISKIDLVEFVKKVYELSNPQGLGFLHFKEGGLSDEEAQEIITVYKEDKSIALCMDYVKGRACKMSAWKKDGKVIIINGWYDHSDKQFDDLLNFFGLELKKKEEENGNKKD